MTSGYAGSAGARFGPAAALAVLFASRTLTGALLVPVTVAFRRPAD